MRISRLHVDGYGQLSDLDLGPLAAGLTVIVGPNEAGKSTLLDFVRGVLFGFPDRRHRRPFHEPLRGGRHGGSAELLDANGSPWRLERHVDRRQPQLTGPDDQLHDPTELRELLGGADEALFGSVFAFGLDELAGFESLESEEVRELVFSAGILGAGRSASQALRVIDQQRGGLIRPRQQDALANQLRRRLEEVDVELRQARSAAAGFAATRAELERRRELAKDAREETEELHRRARELERLASCWAPWRRGEEAKRALATRGELPAATHALAACALEVRNLGEQLSGHTERLVAQQRLETQLAGIERSISEHLTELGYAADNRALPPLDLGLEEEVAELARRQREARAARQALAGELRPAEAELAEAENQLLSARGEAPAEQAGTLAEQLRAARQLRGLVGTLDRLDADAAARRHEAALRALAERPSNRAVVPAALILIAIGALTSYLLMRADQHLGAIVVAGLAVLGTLTLVIGSRRTHRRVEVDAGEEVDVTARRTNVRATVTELGARLGLGDRPEGEQIDALIETLDAGREQQRQLQELERAATRVSERVAGLRQRRDALTSELASIDDAVARIAEKLNLPEGLHVEVLARATETLRSASDLIAASARVAPEVAALRDATAAYEHQVAALCVRLGRPAPEPANIASAIGLLSEELDGALRALREREQLTDSVTTAAQLLDEVLGAGADAARLRRELASGALEEWESERRAVERRLVEANAHYDECLSAQLDAERALAALTSSDEIAALAQERERLAADLDDALSRWLSLGLSSHLIEATLGRYESERQPVVIAKAAGLFATVTDGAYVKLVAREEGEQRRHGIEAITPNGVRVDTGQLSRGTAEQLYLCVRLAFAATFAERAVALPLVLDDVLVNFDPERARAMTRAIAEVAMEHQVIVFTCHPHLAEAFREASPSAQVLPLARLR